MKKILITAKNSYIGNYFNNWIKDKSDFSVDFISCRNNEWEKESFENYNIILHVAGIAHVNASNNMEEQYYKINRDLTIKLAEKAKSEGVEQFIFMSSMIVYGESNKKLQNLVIGKDTDPTPNGFYGKSKLEAERGLIQIMDSDFSVAIIRAPMVYGKGSKGNFLKLSKLAYISPFFPKINNQRSMIHIDNLCEFIRLLIINEEVGIFHPQNQEYVCTSDLVKMISNCHNKKIILTKFFNPFIKLLGKKISLINKMFGTYKYNKELSIYKEDYCIRDFKESINLTEK